MACLCVPLNNQAAERQVALALPDLATTSTSTDSPEASAAAATVSEGGGDVEVVFLGTGSAIPSKYRNVSGIYLRCDSGGGGGEGKEKGGGGGGARGMLLDCGEGSLGQLASLYEGDELCEGE